MRKLFLLLILLPIIFGFKASATFNLVTEVSDDPPEAQGVWETIYDPTLGMNYTQSQANYRNIVTPEITGSWTKIRVTVAAESDEATNSLTGSVCIRSGSTDDCTASPTQLLWNSSSSVYIATDSEEVSDSITFSFDSDDTLLVNVYTAGGEGRYDWEQGDNSYEDYGNSDGTMTQSVSYSVASHIWNIELVEGWTTE